MKYFCEKPHQSGVVNLLSYCSLPPPIGFFSLCSHFPSSQRELCQLQSGCCPQEWTFPPVADDAAASSREVGSPAQRGREAPVISSCCWELCLFTEASLGILQLCTSQLHRHSKVNSKGYLLSPAAASGYPGSAMRLACHGFHPQAGNHSTSTHRFEDVTPC